MLCVANHWDEDDLTEERRKREELTTIERQTKGLLLIFF